MRSFAVDCAHEAECTPDLWQCRWRRRVMTSPDCVPLRIKASPIRARRASGADGRKRQRVQISPRARASRYRSITAVGIRARSETTMSFRRRPTTHVNRRGRRERRRRFEGSDGEVADHLLRVTTAARLSTEEPSIRRRSRTRRIERSSWRVRACGHCSHRDLRPWPSLMHGRGVWR